jgi:drug/metabolite transporter superfamily protein YnfA
MKIQKDKIIHFTASGVLASVVYLLFMDLWIACGASLAVGIFKEVVWDWLLKRGTPDWFDMVANVAGIASAAVLISVVRIFI